MSDSGIGARAGSGGPDAADGNAPLRVDADLRVSVDGAEARVESTGSRILVQFESLPDTVRALRGRPVGTERFLRGAGRTSGLTVEFRTQDRIVAVAGAEARPGIVPRLTELGQVEIRVSGLVGAAYADLRDTVAAVLR